MAIIYGVNEPRVDLPRATAAHIYGALSFDTWQSKNDLKNILVGQSLRVSHLEQVLGLVLEEWEEDGFVRSSLRRGIINSVREYLRVSLNVPCFDLRGKFIVLGDGYE